MMVGVLDVFPADGDDNKDPLLFKKMKSLKSMWELEKDILGFMCDGMNKTMMLDKTKHDSLLVILHSWVQHSY